MSDPESDRTATGVGRGALSREPPAAGTYMTSESESDSELTSKGTLERGRRGRRGRRGLLLATTAGEETSFRTGSCPNVFNGR